MTIQERFEQWSNKYALYVEPLTTIGRRADCKAAYLAAKQDSAAEIAQLQADNLKLLEVIRVLKETK